MPLVIVTLKLTVAVLFREGEQCWLFSCTAEKMKLFLLKFLMVHCKMI